MSTDLVALPVFYRHRQLQALGLLSNWTNTNRMVAEGRFPPPTYLSPRLPVWAAPTILKHLRAIGAPPEVFGAVEEDVSNPIADRRPHRNPNPAMVAAGRKGAEKRWGKRRKRA